MAIEQNGLGDRLLMVREVAELMRVSNMTVYRLIKAGDLPAIRVGKNFRIRRSDVESYLGDRFELDRLHHYQPQLDREFAEWIVEMELAWTGFDCASGDHPMNTSIRHKRPDARAVYYVGDSDGAENLWMRSVPAG